MTRVRIRLRRRAPRVYSRPRSGRRGASELDRAARTLARAFGDGRLDREHVRSVEVRDALDKECRDVSSERLDGDVVDRQQDRILARQHITLAAELEFELVIVANQLEE